ncbi:MAG: type II secretion system protein [Eggerthellaceae bacterium]|nr:type II secretion system protein [Eggerthellaceae bacterium]
MEGTALAAGGALAAAALAGAALGRWLVDRAARVRRAEALVGGPGAPGGAWLARNGVAPLMPLARIALRLPALRSLADEAADIAGDRGLVTAPDALVSLLGAAVIAAGAAGWALSGTPVCAVAVGAGLLVAAGGAVRSLQDRRRTELRDQVPEALRSMGVCFRAGLSLSQTLAQVSREVGGALGGLFAQAAARLETGSTATEALAALRGPGSVPELSFVAVSLDVQHHSGGSLAAVLDAARESVEGELELRRSLRVQTAQAKLSARIVTLMPFILVAVFSLVSEDFLAPFFESVAGMALLATALGMQAIGVLVVRRMLAVETG